MEINWTEGFTIRTRPDGNAFVISANREGLLSLAGILAALAEQKPGSHLHLDQDNSLEDGSVELVLEKTP